MDRKFDDYKKLVDEHLLDFLPNVDNKSRRQTASSRTAAGSL